MHGGGDGGDGGDDGDEQRCVCSVHCVAVSDKRVKVRIKGKPYSTTSL